MGAIEFRCEVKEVRTLTPSVIEIAFAPRNAENRPFEFQAGQFISLVIPGAGPKGRDLRRAYSIASPPESPLGELCVKRVDSGPGTRYLFDLKPGDSFQGYTPYGSFVYEIKPGRHACFISTGTGIAPYKSIVLSNAYQAAPPKSTLCLLGVPYEEEILYGDIMANIKGLKWVPAISRPSDRDGEHWKGFRGRVTDYLYTLDTEFPWLETEFYVCGNGAMISDVKSLLASKNISLDAIHEEAYYK